MALDEKIEKRALQPHHIMVASILAGLNEMGMLNQASVNVAARRAGRYLAEYTKAKELILTPLADLSREERVKILVETLDRLLSLGTRVKIDATKEKCEIAIFSMGCKFCPKGVGEAELKGALCPYPGLLEEYVNAFLAPEDQVKLLSENRRQLRKIDDSCIMVLR